MIAFLSSSFADHYLRFDELRHFIVISLLPPLRLRYLFRFRFSSFAFFFATISAHFFAWLFDASAIIFAIPPPDDFAFHYASLFQAPFL